ncbi:MAG: ribonuclease R, partial [Patescibacteria group bacterium]|nr:ribonuclease R [Patescibacteria group bacterium]
MTEKNMHYVEGTLRIGGKGIGYVEAEGFEDGIEISPADLNMALHRDRVRALLLPKVEGRRQSGEVVEILFRYKFKFVGTIKQEDGVYFLAPDDPKMYANIIIPPNEAERVQPNEKVYVHIIKWSDPKTNPLGSVLSVLGKKGDNDVEMRAIILEKGLSSDFPKEVEEEAELIDRHVNEEEIAKRRDMRKVTTFTIDPVDAKDFDDALSYQELQNGDIEVGIHIADVSHYVRPGTKIDAEAAERATSIYLVDRTIPMLPEVLSNDVCSLNPNQDKLTFSAIFVFSKEALRNNKIEIVDEWFGRTVIHSDKRFSYEEAQEILDKKEGSYYAELKQLDVIAKLLQKERFEKGAIAFEKDEVRFELDEFARP